MKIAVLGGDGGDHFCAGTFIESTEGPFMGQASPEPWKSYEN